MASVSVPKADSPTCEEPVPDLSKLHIDDSLENGKTRLTDMHQLYIDKIAQHMDLKDVIRVQRTCKDLHLKGFYAQRLFKLPINISHEPNGKLRFHVGFDIRWMEEQMKAANFRFTTEGFTIDRIPLSLVMERLTYFIGGRGTIERLVVDVPPHFFRGVDPQRFNAFMENFKVSSLDVRIMPLEFFQLPAMKKLKYLRIRDSFPLSLCYFLDTDISKCELWLERRRRERLDSDEMHLVLQKWMRNEMAIDLLEIRDFYWVEQSLFHGWKMVKMGQRLPHERPLVIRMATIDEDYRVIRPDETVLWINRIRRSTYFREIDPTMRGFP